LNPKFTGVWSSSASLDQCCRVLMAMLALPFLVTLPGEQPLPQVPVHGSGA
jgi:hypothetical protein